MPDRKRKGPILYGIDPAVPAVGEERPSRSPGKPLRHDSPVANPTNCPFATGGSKSSHHVIRNRLLSIFMTAGDGRKTLAPIGAIGLPRPARPAAAGASRPDYYDAPTLSG